MKRLVLLLICALLVPYACLAEEVAGPVFAEQYGVRWFEEGELLGLEDADGNVLLPAQFEYAGPFTEELVEGRPTARVNADGGAGMVDAQGNIVVEPAWGRIAFPFGGAACATEDKSPFRTFFVDMDGGATLGFSATSAQLLAPDRLALHGAKSVSGGAAPDPRAEKILAAAGSDRCVVVDPSWNVLFALDCSFIDPFREGAARVRTGTGFGFIRADGSWLSEPTWDYAEDFSDGFALVQQDGAHGFLKPDGTDAFGTRWGYATSFHSGVAFVYDGPVHDTDSGPSVAADEWKMIDANGKVLLDGLGQSYNFTNGLAPFEQSGLHGTRYGYLDASGNVVVEPVWGYGGDFSEEGLAPVRDAKTGKCGYIDKTGAVAIPCEYVRAEHFYSGLAAFEADDGRWGYLDTEGNVAIEPVWDCANSFMDSETAIVSRDDQSYCINRSGEVLGKGDMESFYQNWW